MMQGFFSFVLPSEESSKFQSIHFSIYFYSCSASQHVQQKAALNLCIPSVHFYFDTFFSAYFIHIADSPVLTETPRPAAVLLVFFFFFEGAPQWSEENKILYHIITHTLLLHGMWRCRVLLLQIVLCMVQLTPLLCYPPEYHSDPVGAPSCDLCPPDGVFCPVLCSLLFISGSPLLP